MDGKFYIRLGRSTAYKDKRSLIRNTSRHGTVGAVGKAGRTGGAGRDGAGRDGAGRGGRTFRSRMIVSN